MHLKALASLRSLDLSESKITDRGMKEIQGMPQLRDLTLRCSAITDGGAECLKVLTKLRDSEPARYPHDGQRPETPQADEGRFGD